MREYPSNRVDVRSDTVTQPTTSMRTVMECAEVGDDVLGDDPTVIELQNRVATLFGKQAGLFVPSGTMSNAVAIRTHTVPGDEIIIDKLSHIYRYEGGGYAAMSGVSVALVDGDKGMMSAEQVQSAIRKAEGSQSHYPDGSLVCVENTANLGGGACYSQAALDAIAAVAHDNGCKAHVDGARIFNAAVALNVDVKELVASVDSVTFCLSKGLTAPVGSVLCGDKDFIHEARRMRKALGGGMRQAGIIAAAGLVSLDKMIPQLKIDHENAKRLSHGLSTISGLSVETEKVHTNILYFSVDKSIMKGSELVSQMAQNNVKFFEVSPNRFRLVTHSNISVKDINTSLELFDTILP